MVEEFPARLPTALDDLRTSRQSREPSERHRGHSAQKSRSPGLYSRPLTWDAGLNSGSPNAFYDVVTA